MLIANFLPIFIFKLISKIHTVHRAQSFKIRVAEDDFDNFKQIFYNVSTQTHFCHVPLKMVSKYYQIVFNVLRLFFSHDINGYHISATIPILPLFARYIIYKIAAVRFEKSRGEVCLGPGNEVTSARSLSDFWLARVA